MLSNLGITTLGITTKLLLLRVLAIAAGLLIAGVGALGMDQINDQSTTLYRSQVVPMAYLDEIHASELESRLDLHRVAISTTAEARQKRLDGLRTTDDELAKATAGYKRTSPLADSAALRQYETNWAKYLAVRDQQLLPLALAGDQANFSKIQADVAQPLISDAADGIDLLVARHAAMSKELAAAADASHRNGLILMFGMAALGVLLTALLGRFIAARISRPLSRVSTVLDGLANGDLTGSTDITGTDEIGRMAAALDRAIARTRDTIKAVGASTERLALAAGQAATLNGEIAERAGETTSRSGTVRATAQEVSASVQTVASATEQMRSSIAEIANSSSQAATVADEAVTVARSTNETINRLSASSAEIDSVVRVITSIAEQTNLLALNATIEAARAGGAGKGFAVVAGEVKDLAQETAIATSDIGGKVQAIQDGTGAAMSSIKQIGAVVNRVNDYQTAIASAVEEQTATTAEAARNAQEAATGTTEIATSVAVVAEVASASLAVVGESQLAVDELAQLADRLRDLVGTFRT
jgi:methyl-accepting chemotaxis protein